MADFYAAKVRAAIEKLKPKSLAVDIVVVRRSSAFDPDTQSVVSSETTQKATAIIASQTTVAPDGIRVVERVFKIPGAALKVAPAAGDLIRHKGVEYTVVRVSTKQPGGIALIHEVVVAD